MNQYKLSVMNTIIAGILICGILAACGVAEKRYAAPDDTETVRSVQMNIPDNIASSRAKN